VKHKLKPDSHLLAFRCVSSVRMRNNNCFKIELRCVSGVRMRSKNCFKNDARTPQATKMKKKCKIAAREQQERRNDPRYQKSFDILASFRLPYCNLASLISSMFTQCAIMTQHNVAQRKQASVNQALVTHYYRLTTHYAGYMFFVRKTFTSNT